MTEMNERTQYRAAGEPVSEDDRRAMNEYGISHQHKSVYTYRAHVYDRLADALAYARIDSARIIG